MYTFVTCAVLLLGIGVGSGAGVLPGLFAFGNVAVLAYLVRRASMQPQPRAAVDAGQVAGVTPPDEPRQPQRLDIAPAVGLRVDAVASADGITALLVAHLERLEGAARDQGSTGLGQLARELKEAKRLAQVVAAVQQALPQAVAREEPVSSSDLTPAWLTAVTVAPWLMPEEVRIHLPNGYLAMLDQLAELAGGLGGARHVVHWIYCTDGVRSGVHLTLIPGRTIDAENIIAQDLLGPDERRKLGM